MSGRIRMHIFHKCICDKDMDTFRKTWYQSVDITPYHIRTIVRMASEQGFVEGLRFIVQEQGADCLDLEKCNNIFHVACKAGQAEVVKFLLTLEEFDKSTTVHNSQFWNCLSSSSETNNIKVINVLLGCGIVDINKTSPQGVSLLCQAIENRKKRFADYLIQQGADITFVTKCTWLGTISCTCLSAIQMPSLLPNFLKRGGNVNDVYDKNGQSVLMLAIEHNADRKTIEEIVRAGANLSWKNNSGRTSFSVLKSIDQLYGILDAGVTVEDIEKQHKFSTLDFVLNLPVLHPDEKIDILFFLEKGASPNFYKDGETSLLTKACANRFRTDFEENVQILLQYGANPNHVDEKGLSVLQNILKQGMEDGEFRCLRTLLKYPVKLDISNVFDHIGTLGKTCRKTYTSLYQHNLTFDVKGVFQLFIAGADLMINQPGTLPLKCLRCLASYGLFESIKFLMRCGWNTDTEKRWIKDFENEEHFNCSFDVDEYSYTIGITEENRTSLTAVLNEIENEPTTLQTLCRCRIRKQLSSHGHSILPLIEDLPIPIKLKSFLKFEDRESPQEEEVIVNVHRNNSNYRYRDDSDDYDDYYDNYDNDYYGNDDYSGMIFDTESDEWIPKWW